MVTGGGSEGIVSGRREALCAGVLLVSHAALGGPAAVLAEGLQAAPGVPGLRALAFDVFGTVVDWRGSIIDEGRRLGARHGFTVDWGAFADRWAGGYGDGVRRVREGALPWTPVDRILRTTLDRLLAEFEITGLSPEEADEFGRVWERLRPWPDVVPGLIRLRTRYTTATLSNGNVSLLVNLSKHGGLPWDCVLSAELARHYKPDREVYDMAARLLGLAPAEILMVAAHPYDLRGAKGAGCRTALVLRPSEYGPGAGIGRPPTSEFDLVADDLLDLADRLAVGG